MNVWLWAVLVVEAIILILAGAVTGRTIDFTVKDYLGGLLFSAVLWTVVFIGAGAAGWFLVAPGVAIAVWDLPKINREFTYTYQRWVTVTLLTAAGFILTVTNS